MKLVARRTPIYLLPAAFAMLASCSGTAPPTAGEAPEPAAASFTPLPINAPSAEPLPSAHPNSIQPETTLTLVAGGEVRRAPDIAVITTGVQTQAPSAVDAMKANAEAMNGVLAALEKANVAKKDMQTQDFSLLPNYDYANMQDGQSPRLVGYVVSNQLNVKVRNLDTLGRTMDALVAAGGNTFSGLSFGLADDRAARDEARALAVGDAVARAELYAKAIGYKVARIVTITENSDDHYMPMPMMRSAGIAAEMSTPIAGGEVSYSVRVNVTFELRK